MNSWSIFNVCNMTCLFIIFGHGIISGAVNASFRNFFSTPNREHKSLENHRDSEMDVPPLTLDQKTCKFSNLSPFRLWNWEPKFGSFLNIFLNTPVLTDLKAWFYIMEMAAVLKLLTEWVITLSLSVALFSWKTLDHGSHADVIELKHCFTVYHFLTIIFSDGSPSRIMWPATPQNMVWNGATWALIRSCFLQTCHTTANLSRTDIGNLGPLVARSIVN